MELEDYISHLQGLGDKMKSEAVGQIVAPAAEQLLAEIKQRTAAGNNDAGDSAGYYGGSVVKKQTALQTGVVLKTVNVNDRTTTGTVAADIEMNVEQDKVVLGFTTDQSGNRNRGKYYATAQEITAYSNDVETRSEELSYKILNGG